jgi:hypothetical protein
VKGKHAKGKRVKGEAHEIEAREREPGTQKYNLMIRKLKSGQYRIYSRKKDEKTNKRKNLGTFDSIEAAKKHEKAIQYFKHG